MIDRLERRVLLDGTSLTVMLGDQPQDQGTVFHYHDDDGTHIYAHYSKGSTTFEFEGAGLYVAYMKKTICIYGTHITLSSLEIDDGGPTSTLSFTASGGDKVGTIGQISAGIAIGNFLAPSMELVGPMSATDVNTFTLGSATGATINFGGMTPISKFTAGSLIDTTVTSTVPIDTFSVKDWSHVSLTPSFGYTGTTLGKFTVGGDYSEGLKLTGGSGVVLQGAMVKGTLGGNWDVAGNSWYTGAFNVDPNFHLIQGGYNESFKSKGNAGGSYDVGSFGQFSVGGDLTGAHFNLNYPYVSTGFDMTKFTVRGTVSGLNYNSVGSLGTLKFGSLLDSTIDLGSNSLAPLTLATDGDLNNHAWMKSFTVSKTFQNSFISAYDFTTVKLGTIITNNNGLNYGFAGTQFGSLSGKTDLGQSLKISSLPGALSYQQQLDDKHINPGDFKISLLQQF
ncbi:MAG TPA: hypothetical protein VH370_02050 [Humisphaera sp.]|nr:hypothetical protein [Humisphaera sp.]